jgi:hypothetical protein
MKIKLRYMVCCYENKIAVKYMLIWKGNNLKGYVDLKVKFSSMVGLYESITELKYMLIRKWNFFS